MKKAVANRYDYYHLLSGQDFLLKPVQEIQRFFYAHSEKEFLRGVAFMAIIINSLSHIYGVVV